MKSSELLRKAASEIREHGWLQGNWDDDAGHLCAWGALNVATGGDAVCPAFQATRPAREFFARVVGTDSFDIDDWNDQEGRTKEEVLDAFEKAARLAEAEGN